MHHFILPSTTLLIYAASVMTLLLDVHPLKLSLAKKMLYFLGIPLIMLSNIGIISRFDAAVLGRFFPLLAQFPMFLILCAVAKRSIAKVFFVLMTTIFLSFPYVVVMASTRFLIKYFWLRAFILIGVILLFLLLIKRFMKPDFNYVIEYFNTADILRFSIIPVCNNILSYSISHYTALLQNIPVRTLIFASTLAAYFLTMRVFRSTREVQRLQAERAQLEMRMDAANEQLLTLRQTQEQAAIYRHDMRHHLALIREYLAKDDLANAMDYISNAQSDIDAVTPANYCQNNTVNLILSFFVSKAAKAGVSLQIEADLPQTLPLPETELCAILSNGLENAVIAAAECSLDEKTVSICCRVNQGNLLIFIENPYSGSVLIENEIPKSSLEGHGFGVKSIQMLTKKYDGYCSFTAKDGIFTLKAVLPLTFQTDKIKAAG